MELVAKGTYHNLFCSLVEGDTTHSFAIPAEVKRQMLEDHPDLFEVLDEAEAVPETKLEVETPEDSLAIETPGKKSRKRG